MHRVTRDTLLRMMWCSHEIVGTGDAEMRTPGTDADRAKKGFSL